MNASSSVFPSTRGGSSLPEFYAAESARIRAEFERTGDGSSAVLARTALLDGLIGEVALREGSCIAAMGGYGRRALFPHSDVDLLLLCENAAAERQLRSFFASLSQGLWDLSVRVSPATRTLEECGRFNRDNAEFSV